MQQRQRPKTRRQPEASRISTESRGRSAAEKTAEKRAEKTAEEAKCNQNIRAGTHEAVRRELVAKNPGGGVGGQLDGHREEKRRDPKKTRRAEEAERDPERTEVTGEEDPLPKSDPESIEPDFQEAKHIRYYIGRYRSISKGYTFTCNQDKGISSQRRRSTWSYI